MRSHLLQSRVPSAGPVLTVVAMLAAPALAQPFAFHRFAITSGGTIGASAGDLSVSLSVGQPVVGSAGGGFEMTFGFWGPEGEAAPRAPQIESWASVRLHAGAPLAIVLDPSGGSVVSESRHSPVRFSHSGIFEIAVRFDQPVRPSDGQLDANDVTIRDSSGRSYTPNGLSLEEGGRLLRIAFASGTLPDRRRYVLDVAGRFESLAGQPVAGDSDCEIRGLVADVNSSGRVDLVDVLEVLARVGLAADQTTARYDIDTDGTITLADAALALLRYSRSAG